MKHETKNKVEEHTTINNNNFARHSYNSTVQLLSSLTGTYMKTKINKTEKLSTQKNTICAYSLNKMTENSFIMRIFFFFIPFQGSFLYKKGWLRVYFVCFFMVKINILACHIEHHFRLTVIQRFQ